MDSQTTRYRSCNHQLTSMLWSADRCRLAIEHREQHQVENRTAPGCAFLFTSASYIALNCATVTTGLWQSTSWSISRGNQDDRRKSTHKGAIHPCKNCIAISDARGRRSRSCTGYISTVPSQTTFDWGELRNTVANQSRFRSPWCMVWNARTEGGY